MSGQDRLAIAIIEDAEQKGELKSDLQESVFFKKNGACEVVISYGAVYMYVYVYT